MRIKEGKRFYSSFDLSYLLGVPERDMRSLLRLNIVPSGSVNRRRFTDDNGFKIAKELLKKYYEENGGIDMCRERVKESLKKRSMRYSDKTK